MIRQMNDNDLTECVRLIRDEDALAAMRGARGAVPERPAAETVCDYLQRGETDRHGL